MPLPSTDAAELEQLRREAALLREQLENALAHQSPSRPARDVHQLEARIDSLAARNSKLMETLKEARQQLLALREEVDRLGSRPAVTACCWPPTTTTPSTSSHRAARCA
ncbi:proteasome-associated ATPase domain protein [Mycobacterium kansasii]|uniref:Proteasome-associated ATPase domain protein n=1 Tax=Mycobacterium kansasii TaxID=1768 RepID=A0A1V3X5A8_MYCKA|nr:proteasome-associated ATPase domain protein [Mycobacterium kansasii]